MFHLTARDVWVEDGRKIVHYFREGHVEKKLVSVNIFPSYGIWTTTIWTRAGFAREGERDQDGGRWVISEDSLLCGHLDHPVWERLGKERETSEG